MLKINGLTKIYGRSDVKAVDDLSLEVESGEIFGFIGPNGAGKSTTIKCVTGITGFNAGTIEVNGFDVRKNPIEAKRSIGYVSDSHVVYDQLTGAEYVDFMASIYGVADKESYKSRLENYIDVFGLKDAFNEPIKSYSHGMQQKINVIGAIIHNPPLLILDEPLTGLDPQSAYELKEMMKEHCKTAARSFSVPTFWTSWKRFATAWGSFRKGNSDRWAPSTNFAKMATLRLKVISCPSQKTPTKTRKTNKKI